MFTQLTFKHKKKAPAKSLSTRIKMYFTKPHMRLPIEETLNDNPVPNDAVTFIRNGLTTLEPGKIVQNLAVLNRMNRADIAIVILLDKMDQLVGEAETEEQLCRLVAQQNYMHDECMKEVRSRLKSYETLVRSGQNAKAGNRPADIARMWYRPVEWLLKFGMPSSRWVLNRIYGHNTMPIDEILTPFWIDAYTGEEDPDDIMTITDPHTGEKRRLEIKLRSDKPKATGEDFDEERIEWAELEDSRDDVKEPVFMEMQADGMPDDHLGTLRSEFYPILQEFRAEIERALDEQEGFLIIDTEKMLAKRVPWWKNYPMEMAMKIAENVSGFPKTAYPEFVNLSKKAFFAIPEEERGWFKERRALKWPLARKQVRESKAGEEVIGFLQDNADAGENPANLAAVFLGVQHGLGFEEGDAEQVSLHGGIYGTLEDFNEEWLDDIIQSLDGRSNSTWNEITPEELETYSAKVIADYAEMVPVNHKDVTHTRAYVKGYLNAMSNGARSTKVAIATGWDNWREWKSPEGNKNYLKGIGSGMEPKEAMKAFWAIVNRESIVSAHQTGLMLSSKRFIDFKIAEMKIRANEIAWQKDQKEWLKATLTNNKWGLNLIPLL